MKDLIQETIDVTAKGWLDVARHLPPAIFNGAFAGLIANVVANLPDDYWEQFIIIEPCGEPGCDCHLVLQPAVVKAFVLMREDHQNHCTKTSTE